MIDEGTQLVSVPAGSIERFYEMMLLQTVDAERAAAITKRYGFSVGFSHATIYKEGTTLENLGMLAHQLGTGSSDGFVFEELDSNKKRMRFATVEHAGNKSRPCFWTSGYVEGFAIAYGVEGASVEIEECVSQGRGICVYRIETTPRRRLERTTHAGKTAFSFPSGEAAVSEFRRALEEGRPGLAFTPRPTAELKADFPGVDLECYQVGEGQGSDVIPPYSLGVLDTLTNGAIKKSPVSAILLTAVPAIARKVADPSIAALLHSLADTVQGPTSDAVAFVQMPDMLARKFPLLRERYQSPRLEESQQVTEGVQRSLTDEADRIF